MFIASLVLLVTRTDLGQVLLFTVGQRQPVRSRRNCLTWQCPKRVQCGFFPSEEPLGVRCLDGECLTCTILVSAVFLSLAQARAEANLGFQRNSSGANSVRLRRHTSQVCAPGVSISMWRTPFEPSHARRVRLISIKWSSVPQAIQSNRKCVLALASSAGNCLSKSGVIPPELNAPIHAN